MTAIISAFKKKTNQKNKQDVKLYTKFTIYYKSMITHALSYVSVYYGHTSTVTH